MVLYTCKGFFIIHINSNFLILHYLENIMITKNVLMIWEFQELIKFTRFEIKGNYKYTKMQPALHPCVWLVAYLGQTKNIKHTQLR